MLWLISLMGSVSSEKQSLMGKVCLNMKQHAKPGQHELLYKKLL